MINNTHTPICISVSNSIVSINDTLFNQTVENTTVISSAGSMELLLSTCDFMSFSKITLRTYTFAMLYSCCFSGLESNAIDIDSTSKYSLNDVNFNQSCPINSATASLSSEKKAYAIVTIVVFFSVLLHFSSH